MLLGLLLAATGGCKLEPGPELDVLFEPTPPSVVAEMLRLAQAGPDDVVYDLGCGDGRIVIAAAKERGARGVCVDLDPQRIRESQWNAQQAGVAERITFRNQDLFATDLAPASVVTLFLSPQVNRKLCSKLWRELKPGTRVVSYAHDMGDWKPDEISRAGTRHRIFLWTLTPGAIPPCLPH